VSRYIGNHDRCPHCQMRYADLKTGLTYRDVYHFIWCRQWKRKSGVLGAWHEIKKEMWRNHIDSCPGVPF
jgi:hypothetical protein